MIDNIYTISPQQINYILELSVERNFQKASANCFVTQPTLSMQVKKAEESLGFLIFDRSRNPLELTNAGKKLIPLLKDVQTEYGRIWKLKEELEGKVEESMRIGIIPTISSYLLLDIYEDVQSQLPNVQFEMIELKSEELIKALDEKKIDMGIMAGPFNQARIRTIPLYREEILIYAPELKGKELNPDMLESLQPWLLSKGNCLRTQMIHFCELNSESQTRSWNYEGGSIDLLKKMVDLNGGYTLIPKFYDKTSKTRRLRDASTKEYPAREIIAMFPERSIKLDICMSISRLIQLKYGQRLDEDMRILSWR